MKRIWIVAISAGMLATPLVADPALGLWKTEPDRKNLTSHIEIRTCGAALCGKIKKAFNASGASVQTPNVGRELFWDLKPKGDGTYDSGTVYVPLLDVTANAKMTLTGNRLAVTGCKGPICDGQVWTRLP
jgi:uncharacterized protein (DUF2147 family)